MYNYKGIHSVIFNVQITQSKPFSFERNILAQPQSHLALGAVVGAACFPHSPLAQIFCIVGAGIPDVPIVMVAIVDMANGRVPFSSEKEGNAWFTAKEITHSPFLWMFGMVAGLIVETVAGNFPGTLIFAFFGGIFSHWIVDVLTHCGPKFRATDQSLAWPLYQLGLLPKLGQFCGIWEYRGDKPGLAAKPPELVMSIVCLCIFLLLTLHNYPTFVWWPS